MYCVLLGTPRQPTCMKLGNREPYQPMQSCLGISNKSVAVPRQDSIRPCCPVWALQHIFTCIITVCPCMQEL